MARAFSWISTAFSLWRCSRTGPTSIKELEEMMIVNLPQRDCLSRYWDCSPLRSDVRACCTSLMLAIILGFFLVCRGLGGAWRGGCAGLLPVLGRSIRQGPSKRGPG